MKSFYLFLPLVSSTALAGQFTVSPKIGHQNMAFSASKAKTVTDISTTELGQAEEKQTKTTKEDVRDSFNNTAVTGIRGTYSLDSLDLSADLDNARYHFSTGFTDVYSLSVLTEIPFYMIGNFRSYALGGASFKWIKNSGDREESRGDYSFKTRIEALEALNLEAGIGSSYKIADRFSMNVEYKYSDTLASDGHYAKLNTTGRTDNFGLIKTNSRTEFEHFRATIQELSLIANWSI